MMDLTEVVGQGGSGDGLIILKRGGIIVFDFMFGVWLAAGGGCRWCMRSLCLRSELIRY